MSVSEVTKAKNAYGYSIENLNNGVFLFRRGMFANIFIVTEEGVIATDPISKETAFFYKKAIAEKTPLPVKYLIYSHDHSDHIAGGGIFQESAQIISHRLAKEVLIKRGNPDIILPDLTFEDKHTIILGGKRVDLLHFGPGHSPSSSAIYLPEDRLLMMVDYVGPNSVPYQDFPDVDIRGFIHTLEKIEQMDFDRYIYGHGPTGNKLQVTRLRQYMQDLLFETGQAAMEITYEKMIQETGVKMDNFPLIVNKTFDRIIETVMKMLRPQYSDMYGFEEWAPLNIRRIIHFHHMEN